MRKRERYWCVIMYFEATPRTEIGLSVEGHFKYIVMENQRALHIFPIIITVSTATNIAKG